MRFIYIITLLITCTLSQAQVNFNMENLASVELDEPGNDIWGYVDATGLEYAIMGSRTNTRIWSLEDPSNPIERAVIPGFATTWRDIKTFEDHIYVTNDGDPRDGLLIIDMSLAPGTITYEYNKPIIFIEPEVVTQVILDTIDFTTQTDTTYVINGQDTISTNFTIDTIYNVSMMDTMFVVQDTTLLGQCHNLFIDENGFCYLSGCRIPGANKAIIFDLNQDKKNPPIVGIHGGGGDEYSHDLFVQNDIMYSSEINVGVLTLFDVTDKANIVELGDATTTMNFTHNTWASTDGKYAFTTDERANAFVDAYDVSDPGNIIRLDSYQPLETANTGVIPHNTHYKDGFLITSWYTDGVVITDVNMPDNMIKVGAYDTYPIPISGDGFDGCWGAYPWLPSGLVITSNISNVNDLGQLDIFRPTYVRAAYLHGTVTDKDSGANINGVDILINNPDQANEGKTNPLGEYKTGIEQAGTYEVVFTHPEYLPETLSATIQNGVVTILDAQLTKRPVVRLTGTVIDGVTTEVIPNAKLKISNKDRTIEIQADDQGNFDQTIFDESYDIIVGAWGYRYGTINNVQFDGSTGETFELAPGIEDNFALDLGWAVNGNVTTGLWVRDVPIGTFRNGVTVNVDEDITDDIGNECYMTGNGGGDAASDDVDDGVTRLLSPKFNVSDYNEPLLQFNAWFTIGGGQGPINDTMFVRIWDKSVLTTLAMYTESTGGWTDVVSIPLKGLVDTEEDLSISVVISDLIGSGHLLEGGFDAFRIAEGMPSSTTSISESDNIEIYPNPFSDNINILLEANNYNSISLYDIMGKQVYRSKVIKNQTVIGRELADGFYTIIIERMDGSLLSKKLIKQ